MFGCKGEELCNSRLDGYPSLATGYIYILTPNITNFNFKLEYNSKGQIIRRVGGVYNDNFRDMTYFSDNVYDSIAYISDTIRILNIYGEPRNYGTYRQLQMKTDIVLSDNGNFKVKYRDDGLTTSYIYNEKNQIFNTISIYSDGFAEEEMTWNTTYSYSADGNLTSYKLIFKTSSLCDTSITTFSNYDKAPNPFKLLQVFDDTFIRSLSENNFRIENNTTWDFYYDNCGNLKFQK